MPFYRAEHDDPLADLVQRNAARTLRNQPLTPAERLDAFQEMGFTPHGLYLPQDRAQADAVDQRLLAIGAVPDPDEQLRQYFALQAETAQWAQQGLPGRWTGQQALARSEARFRVAGWGRRGGKCLAVDTPVPTPDGWTTMGEVRVGDTLFDERGQPCRVIWAGEPLLGKPCYAVCFSDGHRIIADAEHLWWVDSRQQRRTDRNRQRKPPVLRTTQELAEDTTTHNHWGVPCARPIQLDEAPLPIHPYVLGVWLGDGLSTEKVGTTVFSNDPEIMARIEWCGYDVTRLTRQFGYGVLGIRKDLRALELFDNKHVPPLYLRGSETQRLALLHGLMDTDGTVDARGKCEFTTTRQCLAEGVVELLESLGQKARVTMGRATLYGKDCGPKYRVHFTPTIIAFTLPRKVERQDLGGHFRERRYITSVTPVPSVPVRCIEVDAPSHLFLIDGFIPTHNTYYALHEALAYALKRPRCTVWVSGPIMKHVSRLWDPLVELIADLGLKTLISRNTSQEKLIQLDTGARIEGISLENVWSAAGASVNFAIIDEAAQLIPEAWTRGVMPTLADTMGHCLLLSSYEGQEGFFYEQVRKAREAGLREWEAFHSESWKNFFVFRQGEDSPAILQAKRNAQDPLEFLEQYGAAPSSQHLMVYPEFKPRIHAGDYPFDPALPVRLAVDPSKGANAYAVAVIQKDPASGRIWMCDEYYRVGAMAEDVTRALDRRAWRPNVTDVVMDNADPNEILRWCQAGYPAFAVQDKPEPEMRYPILRRLLRDPVRYWPLHDQKLRQVLATRGLDADAYKRLDLEERHVIEIEVEMLLADARLTPADIEDLRACSHFFVHWTCTAMLDEFANFLRNRPRKNYLNPQERARKYKDHLCDAVGYYCWVFEREDYLAAIEGAHGTALELITDAPYAPVPLPRAAPEEPAPAAVPRPSRHRAYLDLMRSRYAPGDGDGYLVTEVG